MLENWIFQLQRDQNNDFLTERNICKDVDFYDNLGMQQLGGRGQDKKYSGEKQIHGMNSETV